MKSFPLIFSVTENIDDLVHQDEGNRVWKPQPMIYQCSAPVWSFRLSLPPPPPGEFRRCAHLEALYSLAKREVSWLTGHPLPSNAKFTLAVNM